MSTSLNAALQALLANTPNTQAPANNNLVEEYITEERIKATGYVWKDYDIDTLYTYTAQPGCDRNNAAWGGDIAKYEDKLIAQKADYVLTKNADEFLQSSSIVNTC